MIVKIKARNDGWGRGSANPQRMSIHIRRFLTRNPRRGGGKEERPVKRHVLLRTFWEFNRIRYLPTGKGRRIVKIPRPFFLTSTASVDTDAIISYELWGSHSLTVMSLLRKRYDMIALFLQTVPQAHHNLA